MLLHMIEAALRTDIAAHPGADRYRSGGVVDNASALSVTDFKHCHPVGTFDQEKASVVGLAARSRVKGGAIKNDRVAAVDLE
jgi:hypothetical protein